MQLIERAISRARRRLFLSSLLFYAGQFAVAGLAAALLMILIERMIGLSMSLWVYAALAGVVVIAAAVTSAMTIPGRKKVAAMVDDRLKLKDRLGTALYAVDLADTNPFARKVVEDANDAASNARVNQAFKLQPGRVWNVVLPLAAVVALAGWLMPQMDLFGMEMKRERERIAQEQAAAAVEQITMAEAVMSSTETGESRLGDADPTELANELMSLANRDLRDPGMRERAAAQLSDVQERLSFAKESLDLEVKMLKNAMSGLEPNSRGPADEFADALRRGDFKEAQRQLKRLAKQFESGGMTDQEKQQLKQQLQSMSRQLQTLSQQAQQASARHQQQIQQTLQTQGLSQQQIQNLQQQGFQKKQVQQAVQQQLQQQGMGQQQAQQQAQQVAQQVQQMQQQSQAQGQCSSGCNGLGQAMQQMAQSMQQGQQGQGQGQGQGQQSNQQGQQGQQGQGQQAGQRGQGQQGQGQQAQGSMQQGAWQAQQALNQMAQMQNQMQQMQQAQNQMQSAMQNMGNSNSSKQAGTAEGGNPFGAERQPQPYNVETRKDVHEGKGRVIASWSEAGEMAAGEATVEFDQAVTSAKAEAERAITDDRVPRRYHGAIKNYFNQLPESPEDIRDAPPAAPR